MAKVRGSGGVVVLITGCAGGGIGAALSAEFYAKGCTVYASDITLDSMTTLPSGIHKLVLDVTQPATIKTAVDQVIAEQGQIDILVNNAGLNGIFSPLADADLQATKKVFDVNVHGLLAVTQAVVPYMASRRQGKIINVGSVLGLVSHPTTGVYCATKFAVRSITDTLRIELAPFNIKVMLVAPGMVETPLWGKALDDAQEKVKAYKVFAEQRPAILEIAKTFSEVKKTPVDKLAKRVVHQALRRNLKRHFIFGAMSGTFRLMCMLPMWLVDKMIAHRLHWNKQLKPLQL